MAESYQLDDQAPSEQDENYQQGDPNATVPTT